MPRPLMWSVGRLAHMVNTMIEQAKKLFVVEYSVSKDTTRVRSVGTMLKNNVQDIAKNSIADSVPVALLATRSQAEMFTVEFQHHLESQVLSGSRNWKHISEVIEELGNQLLNTLTSDPRKK
jgi:hypothetical protein